MTTEALNSKELTDHAHAIGRILYDHYGATKFPNHELEAIPHDYVHQIADELQLVIAEVIQVWITAGSERDVTLENDDLHRAIHDELQGWADNPYS